MALLLQSTVTHARYAGVPSYHVVLKLKHVAVRVGKKCIDAKRSMQMTINEALKFRISELEAIRDQFCQLLQDSPKEVVAVLTEVHAEEFVNKNAEFLLVMAHKFGTQIGTNLWSSKGPYLIFVDFSDNSPELITLQEIDWAPNSGGFDESMAYIRSLAETPNTLPVVVHYMVGDTTFFYVHGLATKRESSQTTVTH